MSATVEAHDLAAAVAFHPIEVSDWLVIGNGEVKRERNLALHPAASDFVVASLAFHLFRPFCVPLRFQFAEGFGCEKQIAFDGESSRAANRLKFI